MSSPPERPAVSLLAHRNYDRRETLEKMRLLLEPLGGMGRFVAAGSRVLLKPNLVFGRPADKAVNTHPEILRAAIALAREAGASRITVGDSPGFGTAKAAAKASGLAAVAAEEGVGIVEFTPVEDVDPARSFVRLELAREVLEADAVINLPKMKTHGQMLMTLAVKNMFGAVPGPRKFQWHYRAGRDRELFAKVINEITRRVRPSLSILDAVVGMDGMGPTAGNPRPVGFMGASADPWALDAAVMDVLGLERELLFILADAARNGPHEWRDAVLYGDDPATLGPENWRIPELRSLQMHGGFVERHLPGVARWIRSRVSPRPRPKPECIACGYCVDICPAKAMRLEDGKVLIDDAACIRCYCCHELCQHNGMDMESGGVIARLLGL